MLQAYYDCNMKDKFKDLFGNLWIGKNPTPLQGKYLVLYLPARMITDPQVFPSLLFYYGMLTIKATRGAKLILGIPNNNVRKQYDKYLSTDMLQPQE